MPLSCGSHTLVIMPFRLLSVFSVSGRDPGRGEKAAFQSRVTEESLQLQPTRVRRAVARCRAIAASGWRALAPGRGTTLPQVSGVTRGPHLLGFSNLWRPNLRHRGYRSDRISYRSDRSDSGDRDIPYAIPISHMGMALLWHTVYGVHM